MNEQVFIGYVEKALEANPGSIKLSDDLGSLNWDSLARIVFISVLDENEGLHIPGDELALCETVEDLYLLTNKAS